MVSDYIPKRGDVIWLDFNPQSGKEQAGHRPALVLSHESYNKKTGLGLFCPITTSVKGYPFEVAINTNEIEGVVLSNHVKALDWKARSAKYICKLDSISLNDVIERIEIIIK